MTISIDHPISFVRRAPSPSCSHHYQNLLSSMSRPLSASFALHYPQFTLMSTPQLCLRHSLTVICRLGCFLRLASDDPRLLEWDWRRLRPTLLISREPPLSEPRSTPPHNLSLTHQFCIKLTSIQRQVDVKVHPIERPLWRIHPLKVLLQILPRQVGCQCNDLLDPRIFRILGTTSC